MKFVSFVASILLFITYNDQCFAQVPGSGVYGNEWLAGKYGQDWLRIGVTQKGIQTVTLPASFTNKSSGLHLYHRGVEVPLISGTNTTIEFYGVPNDGASDALLYRPYTGVRGNPYYSWFSDESAYFLTYSASTPTKLVNKQNLVPSTGTAESYHLEKELTVFSSSDTYDGSQNLVTHSLDQSYFVEGKGRSSKAYYKRDNGASGFSGDPVFPFPFQLKNLVINPSVLPEIEVLLNGRTNSNNQIKVSIGKTGSSLTANPALIEFSGFITHKVKYPIPVSTDLNSSNVDASGNGHFQLESMKVTTASATTGIFSVNYIIMKYPQAFDMSGLTSKTFNLAGTTNANSNISISNVPAGARIFDITDIDNPRFITGTYNGSTLQAMVSRVPDKELNLLVTTVSSENNKLSTASFTSYSPSSKDYLIISSGNLISAADDYAKYRSADGGAYRTLVVNIRDIYNQFNYGEPSPVAIRRFVDYMLKDGIRKEHNLLLIGISTTLWSKMARELPDEVPTIGFPGSDNLLIEGLAGSPKDVQAIPIGRISATTVRQVTNYLNKVKIYETSKDTGWKKRVLHLSGGKTSEEIQELASELAKLTPVVEKGEFGGSVTPFVKQSTIETMEVDITPEVNNGVGWISYYGHGSSTITDYDLGYITDPHRGYNNKEKFPFMYFNGCGVGNIFNGRNNIDISAGDKMPLASNWINSETGSIAIIANTYYSFLGTSSRYLVELYDQVFTKSPTEDLTIGEAQRQSVLSIIKKGVSEYDIANIHQSLLQGDPVVRVIRMDAVDYEISKVNSLHLLSNEIGVTLDNAKGFRVSAVVSNNGKYVQNQKLTVKLILTYKEASADIRNFVVDAISFRDTLFFDVPNKKNLTRLQVVIDPDNVIKETNENNNSSDLIISWDEVKNYLQFPVENYKDNIPPVMQVFMNGGLLRNEAISSFGLSELQIKLSDNNLLVADSTLVDLYIKPCDDNSCEFLRVSYSYKGLNMLKDSSGNLIVNYPWTFTAPGVYEVLIQGKDLSGNVVQVPYRIKINVSNDKDTLMSNLIVSPNPFTDYVKFEFPVFDLEDKLNKVEIRIFNQKGQLIYLKNESVLTNTWYWISNAKSGLYIYDVIIDSLSGKRSKFRGRIVSQK